MIMEDVIERMRSRDVSIAVVNAQRRRGGDATAFRIGFESPQARTAMQVAERLANLFVQEDLEDRELMADSTNQFLQAQLEDARRRLVEHEKKLEDFRLRNAGRLPSQVQANLQMMQSAQGRLQSLAENANRDRDRLMSIEQLLAEAPPAPPAVVAVSGDTNPGQVPATPAQQLAMAQASLRNLELRLTPQHPDVIRTKRIIAELEAKVTATAGDTPAPQGETTAIAARPALSVARAADLRLQAEEIRRRLESYKGEQVRLEGLMSGYSGRLESTPALESELSELMRDYSTLQEAYTALLKKSEESKIAVNLERRQIGQQFRIIDSPRLPERPISPNRTRLNLMGLLAGLALGVGLVAFLEYRDTTVKTDDDVLISLSLPVLAVIPAMVTERERSARRRRLLVTVAASAVVALAGAAVAAWQLGLLDRWVP
jgi:polysaccharide chain length determinant protein (PEP-CTERM system associated)